jgi:two-component sensor histidine kinase
VCELLTNIFKYAFPGERSGSAHIWLAADDGHIRLTVSDDGVGLPRNFDPQHSPTFGWQLVHNLAKQLGATVSVGREGGTQVSISFPLTADVGGAAGAEVSDNTPFDATTRVAGAQTVARGF